MTSDRAVRSRYCCLGELLAALLIWRMRLGMYLGKGGWRKGAEKADKSVGCWRTALALWVLVQCTQALQHAGAAAPAAASERGIVLVSGEPLNLQQPCAFLCLKALCAPQVPPLHSLGEIAAGHAAQGQAGSALDLLAFSAQAL